MKSTLLLLGMLGLLAAPAVAQRPAAAQQNANLVRARAAYGNLDYAGAVTAAQAALRERLSRDDQVAALEILAYSYGSMDSTRLAVDAFRRLAFLDPNREPDVERVSPRITSLYASALGQVLVVRKVQVDSATFVGGTGRAAIRFAVTRPARVATHVMGPGGFDAVIDSAEYGSQGLANWTATRADGTPVPPGQYQVVITAREGRNEFAVPVDVVVRHGRVDTAAHLTSLPGYTAQPEMQPAPRTWRPLGLTVLYGGLASGAALALQSSSLSSPSNREVAITGGAALLAGLVMSLAKPDPRPVESAILYNRLLREQLARQNEQIARENAVKLRQVLVTVVPAPKGAGR